MNAPKLLLRILSYFREHKWLTAGTIGYVLLMGLLDAAPPKLIQYIIDSLLLEQDLPYFLQMVLLLFGVITVRNLLGPGRHVLRWKLTGNIILKLRHQTHFHLQRLSLAFFHRRKSGDIAARVVNDINQVEHSLASILEALPMALVMLACIAAVLFVTNVRPAAIATAPSVLIVALLYHYSRRVRPLYKDVRTQSGELNAYVFENIAGIKEIKALTREEEVASRFNDRSRDYYDSRMRAVRYSSYYMQLLRYVGELGLILVVGFGGYEVWQDRLTAGGLTAFILYVRMYYQPLNQLNHVNNMVQQGLASGERIFELLDSTPAIQDPAEPVRLHRPQGAIELQRVSLQYPGTEDHALRDVNLAIAPREKIGIVGPTGGGKTSVVSLITRFYDCTGGRVLIDGIDIRHLRQSDLRKLIGIVFQEPYLFNTTIEENIRFGNPNASFEAVRRAAQRAQIHEFIDLLPRGYETIIGERGVRLSQGQRQRIAIARTLLQDPSILIFDEATSAVDNITEAQIQSALDELLENRTSLIIAHRLRTVENVDRLVVIEDGRIVDVGTREELLSRDSLYRALRDMASAI